MDSILHECLEMIESKGLPEGDFLKACNALKKAFTEKDDGVYKTVPLQTYCMFKSKLGETRIWIESATYKKRDIHWVCHNLQSFKLKIQTDTHSRRDEEIVTLHHGELSGTIKCLTYSIRPTEVDFQTPIGNFGMTQKAYLQSRWAEEKLKEEITGEEDEELLGNFDSDLFYDWIGVRIYALAHAEADRLRSD
jgi:hypothetical protein